MVRRKNTKRKNNKTRRISRSRKQTKKNYKAHGKHFHAMNCSPSGNADENDFTCYSKRALRRMRDKWNVRHPDTPIPKSKTPHEIWMLLRQYLSETCHTESCWLKQDFMGDDDEATRRLIEYAFSPVQPDEWKKNPVEWLTTRDITKVMQQYETAYKCFNFVGPSPIDFDDIHHDGNCVWEELCKFSLGDHIERGKTKIGMIFNLDPHYKEGSHWVSLFVNTNKKYIFFMDSNGDKEPKRIKRLIDKIVKQGKALGISFKVLRNHPRWHQKKNTECGMYSLYTIISLLTDKHNPQFFINNRVPDNDMIGLRNKYFNPHL